MSAFLYGRSLKRRAAMSSEQLDAADQASGQTDNRLITALAAIIPADVIAGHALALAWFTKTDDAGTTTITEATPLKISFVVLLVVTAGLFVIGRGITGWHRIDVVRFFLPLVAFTVWAALIGTSALSPWITGVDRGSVEVAALGIGILLVGVSLKVAPPTT